MVRHAPAAAAIDPAAHFAWAADRAREVARRYRLGRGSQEELDLVQVACLTVVRKAGAYQPRLCPPDGDHGGLFRGWAAIDVRSECVRAARRLRNGGTYHTRRETRGVALVATPFSDLARPDGAFDVPDDCAPDDPCETPAERPLPPIHEPGTYGRRLAGRRY